MPAPVPDLLDTNILLHLVRSDTTGQRIKAEYDPLMTDIRPVFCTVTQGELRALAYQFKWGTR